MKHIFSPFRKTLTTIFLLVFSSIFMSLHGMAFAASMDFSKYNFGYIFQNGVHQAYLGTSWTGGKTKGHIDQLYYNFMIDGYGGLPMGSCLQRSMFITNPTEKAICAKMENMDLFRADSSEDTPAKNLLIKNVTLKNSFRTENAWGGTATVNGVQVKNNNTSNGDLPHTDSFQAYMGAGNPTLAQKPEWLVIQDSFFTNSDGGAMIMGDTWYDGVVYQNLSTFCENAFKNDAVARNTNDNVNFVGSTIGGAAPCGNQIQVGTYGVSPVWLINVTTGVTPIIENPTRLSGGPVIVVGNRVDVIARNFANGVWDGKQSHPNVHYYDYIEDALAAGYTRPPYLELSCSGWRNKPAGCETKQGYLDGDAPLIPPSSNNISTIPLPFAIGNTVQVIPSSINVRETADLQGNLLGTQSNNQTGTLIEGPVSNDNITWWNINYSNGVDGWSGQDNLVVTSASTPSSNSSSSLLSPTITSPTFSTTGSKTTATITWSDTGDRYLTRIEDKTAGTPAKLNDTQTTESETFDVIPGHTYRFWMHPGTLDEYQAGVTPQVEITFTVSTTSSSGSTSNTGSSGSSGSTGGSSSTGNASNSGSSSSTGSSSNNSTGTSGGSSNNTNNSSSSGTSSSLGGLISPPAANNTCTKKPVTKMPFTSCTIGKNSNDIFKFHQYLSCLNVVEKKTSCTDAGCTQDAKRQELVSVAVRMRGIPLETTNYQCKKRHTDISIPGVGGGICEAAEKAQTAGLISQTNKQFRPLDTMTRSEAYSVIMKSICIHPTTTPQNWQTEVARAAKQYGFTTRSVTTFEPNRPLLRQELSVLAARAAEWKSKNPESCGELPKELICK